MPLTKTQLEFQDSIGCRIDDSSRYFRVDETTIGDIDWKLLGHNNTLTIEVLQNPSCSMSLSLGPSC